MNDASSDMPPSFAPQSKRERPSARGARRIGNTEHKAASRISKVPPSYPPRQKSSLLVDKPEVAKPVIKQSPRKELNPQLIHSTTTKTRQLPSLHRIFRWLALILIALLAITGAWFAYLYNYGNKNLNHISTLSGAADTPGETYLIVGSDKRSGAYADESVPGQRSDTVMLLHKAPGADPVLLSLPRDTYVEIPEYGYNKLNAAYSLGEGALLVKTVENLTGLTIDHYVEVGMDGVVSIVDAVGSIPLCYDQNVEDPLSGLKWNAGCHQSSGVTALAFARMRYEDPLGDIGRAERQRQVLSSLMKTALSKDLLFSPRQQKQLVGATASALTVDEKDGLWQVGKAGLTLREVMQKGITGTPPIADLSYYPGGIGSTVLLDEELSPQFWNALKAGTLRAADYETLVAATEKAQNPEK